MLKHYVRVAIRNLLKHRVLTLINVSGLSLGLACFSLILLFAVNEFSYDRWQEKAARIFRVDQEWTRDDGTTDAMAGLYMPLGPAMKNDFPDVEQYVRWSATSDEIMKVDHRINRIGLSFADPSVFSVFTFPFIAGTAADALQDPHSLVLTRSKAIQLFGGWDVVGRVVQVKMDSTFEPFTVTAIAEDLPANSSVSFGALGNYDLLKTRPNRQRALDCWHCTNGDNTYVLLRPDSRLMDEPRRLLDFRLRYFPDEMEEYQKTKIAKTRFVLRSLLKAHTTPNVDGIAAVDPRNIWILLSIAGSILLIASINFTTLAIARSASRAKEVGVRKVIGSGKWSLVLQFLTESILLTIVSAVLGCLLVYTLLPWFNQLADRHLEFSLVRFPELSWMIVGLVLLVGVLAGSYPAVVLSSFNPVEVLKTKIRLGGSNLFMRGLVTFQFVLSIGLILATVTMLRQVNYMRSRDLGLIKENTFVITASDVKEEVYYRRFRDAMLSRRDVKGITASEVGLGEGKGQMGYGFDFNGKKMGVIIYP
ncbi:MAG: ABC transporter permease, partial [Bacteroidetes bacterium]|nr:ABC transporter permease [Bacteroidota bacterium]